MRVLVVTGLDMQGSSSTSNAMCAMCDVRCGVLSWQRKRKAKGIFGGSSQQLVIERIPQNDFKTHLAKYYKMGRNWIILKLVAKSTINPLRMWIASLTLRENMTSSWKILQTRSSYELDCYDCDVHVDVDVDEVPLKATTTNKGSGRREKKRKNERI